MPALQPPGLSVALVMSDREIAACLRLRRAVFIDEQGVSEADEVDGQDGQCEHLLGTVDGGPVAAARLLPGDGYLKIQRVCVDKAWRGRGYGADLMAFAIEHVRTERHVASIQLGAQVEAVGFYAKLGFVARGEPYLDAGIMHRDMVLRLQPPERRASSKLRIRRPVEP